MPLTPCVATHTVVRQVTSTRALLRPAISFLADVAALGKHKRIICTPASGFDNGLVRRSHTWHLFSDAHAMTSANLERMTGGGRKIIRCEISLDGGKSWRLAEIQRHAPPNAHGRHWAWVFYTLPVSLGALLSMH